MKYYRAILSLFVLNISITILLLYFANLSRDIEKKNINLKNQIKFTKDQININEIEYSLYNSYEYLLKMQKIYFFAPDKDILKNRISFQDLKNDNIENLFTIGIK